MILSFATFGGTKTEVAIRTCKKPLLDATGDLKHKQDGEQLTLKANGLHHYN